MKWKKQGLVYAPSGQDSWARSHCLLPTPLLVPGGAVRIFFACLDERKYGRVGYVDLDVSNPKHLLAIGEKPVLDLGEAGTFDDCGVVPSCAILQGQETFLYYVGFQRAERVPYMLFTGLATGRLNNDTFQRFARTPVLDRTPAEPFSRGALYVLRDAGGFRAWYWSCTHWTLTSNNSMHYNNVIRQARSRD